MLPEPPPLPPGPPVVETEAIVAADAEFAGLRGPTFVRRRRRRSLFGRMFSGTKSLLVDAFTVDDEHPAMQRTWLARLLSATPAWLVSMVFHMGLIIMLGLVAVGAHQVAQEAIDVEMAPYDPSVEEIYAETLGEQLDVPAVGDAVNSDPEMAFDPSYSLSSLPAVDDPFAAPPQLNDLPGDGTLVFSDIDAPSIGMALSGRQEGRKEALMKAYGGNRTTQQSVEAALAWLSRQQQRDGSWSLDGPYADGAMAENSLAATAMAMIAYLGDGHTHMKDGPYRRTVQRGMKALLRHQQKNGEFLIERAPSNHRLYTHAQCTIAICELYGITNDSLLREHAEQAVQYCIKIQSKEGGWRYYPFEDSDMSVTGWFVMALQSARMAKLEVPSETLARVSGFLDMVSSKGGSQYAYQRGQGGTPAMTAEALLCRQYLGWKQDSKPLVRGVAYVADHPVNWEERNVYYWYYATQVMHHMGGKSWVEWNKVMRQTLPEHQVRTGRERGSWDPQRDQWGASAGRLYVTCLSTYMLEVYYRHLPLYSNGIEAAREVTETANAEAAKPAAAESAGEVAAD